MTLGKRISELMIKEKMTQKELAVKINVTEASMSRYLKDERIPRIDVLVNLSNVFNVSIDYLSGENNQDDEFVEIKRLVARNAGKLSQEQKLELTKILLKD